MCTCAGERVMEHAGEAALGRAGLAAGEHLADRAASAALGKAAERLGAY